ncbi:hypothetical protein C1O63_0478 [Dehalococcoides mccartyi]|nr:hypothetical protein C1O63_0478 [Dehalococcoides mccartyi]
MPTAYWVRAYKISLVSYYENLSYSGERNFSSGRYSFSPDNCQSPVEYILISNIITRSRQD